MALSTQATGTAALGQGRSSLWAGQQAFRASLSRRPSRSAIYQRAVQCECAGPKRVAVIGSGPAGLASALALLRLDTGVESVKVFEKFDQLKPALGAGFNINGGAAVLARLGVYGKLKEIGNPTERIRSRAVDGTELLAFDLEHAIGAFAGDQSALRHDGDLCAFTVMRSDLQKVMAAELPDGTIQLGKELDAIKLSDSGAQLQFRDGTSEEFDLVVGADGIKSRTRQLLFGTSTPQSSSIRIQFGVCPPGAGPRPQDQRQELHQWFGDGAYCLVYTGGGSDSPQDMVALVRQEASAVSSENAGWETSEVKQDCIARLREGRFPKEVEAVAESCERFMDIGVFYHDTLPSWSKGGRVVLLGDAAHAMPPFLGQGANQAIQDAFSLADKLQGVGTTFESTEDALLAYQKARIPPTAAIMQSSRFLGALETQAGVGGFVRNSLFYVMGKLRVAEMVFVNGAMVRV